jgi:hypothetical protein
MAWIDGTVLPGGAYAYSIRAANVGGFSYPTTEVPVQVPATLVVSVARGKARDSVAVAKDALKISGTLALGEGATESGLDPGTRAVQIRFGGPDGPVLLAIPAGDEGWRERRGTWSWKSPKGGVTKATLKFAPVSGAFTLSLARFTFPAPMAESATFFVRVAGEGGSAEDGWTEAKTGLWKIP